MFKSITYKLIAVQVVSAFLLVTVTGLLSYFFLQYHLKQKQVGILLSNTESLAQNTYHYLASRETVLAQISTSQEVKRYLSSFSPYIIQELFIKHNSSFPKLTYVNQKGREEVKIVDGKIDPDLSEHSTSILFIDSSEKPNRSHLGWPRYSKDLKAHVIDMVYYGTNFFDESLGYIWGSLKLSDFSEVVNTVIQDEYTFSLIVDTKGNFIYTPNKQKLATSLLHDAETSSEITKILISQDSFMGEGQIFGYQSFISMKTIQKYNLKVMTVVKESDFLLPAHRFRKYLIVLSIFMLGLGVLFAYLFGRTISRPIIKLTNAANKISQEKNISTRVEMVSNDEIGILSNSFNLMLDYLGDAQNDIIAEKKYSDKIIQTMTDPVIVINPDSSIRALNQAALDQLNYAEHELIKKSVFLILEDKVKRPFSIRNIIQRENIKSIEKTFISKNGAKIPILFSSSLMKDKHHNIQGVVCIAHDISKRKQMEKNLILAKNQADSVNKKLLAENTERLKVELKLKETNENLERTVAKRTAELAQKNADLQTEITRRIHAADILLVAKNEAESANEAKDEFLANISHELRTPMHGILSYSNYGIRKIKKVSQEKLLFYFSQIYKSGNRLMFFLNDLLDLSTLEGKKMPIQTAKNRITELINEVILAFKPILGEKNLLVEVHNKNVPDRITCDAHRIIQVLRNLLSNAVKFTPEGKRIEIILETTSMKGDTYQNDQSSSKALLVTMKDEGPGIPEEELESIFDRFIQSSKTKTGAGGTGLGLSICKEIIKSHGGRIWAENNQDVGSSFLFTLPYS